MLAPEVEEEEPPEDPPLDEEDPEEEEAPPEDPPPDDVEEAVEEDDEEEDCVWQPISVTAAITSNATLTVFKFNILPNTSNPFGRSTPLLMITFTAGYGRRH